MPEMQNIRNDNAHEPGIRFLSLLNLMTLPRFFIKRVDIVAALNYS